MDSAKAHEVGLSVTGQGLTGVVAPVARTARAFRSVLDALQVLVADASALLEALDDLVDEDGREIWMTAGEVELDQWVARVIEDRDAFRRSLNGLDS